MGGGKHEEGFFRRGNSRWEAQSRKSIGIVRGVKGVGGIGDSEGEASKGKWGSDDRRYGLSSSGGGVWALLGR